MHREDTTSPPLARLLRIGWWIVLAVAGMTVLGFAARYWWFLEYFCHFRLQYTYFLSFALVVFALLRKAVKVIVIVVFLGLNLASIIPFYTTDVPAGRGTTRLRLVAANVGANNPQHDQIVRFVRRVDPDFVLLLEANETWSDAVQTIAAKYPYGVREMKAGNFSTVLLSRHPIGPTTRKRFGTISMYALITECDVNGRQLLLIASHLLPPYRNSYVRLRNKHLNDLIDEVAAYDGPIVLAGDLNLTPWSPQFQAALQRGGLMDSRRGFGLQPTWPSFLPGMRIPIDHVLVTPDVTVHSWSRGPFTGSDHLPVVVEFSLDAIEGASATSAVGRKKEEGQAR